MATESAVGWGSLKRQSLGAESGKDLTAHSWLSGVDAPLGRDCLLGPCPSLLPVPHSLRSLPVFDNSMYYFPSSQFLPFLPFLKTLVAWPLTTAPCWGRPGNKEQTLKKKEDTASQRRPHLTLFIFEYAVAVDFQKESLPRNGFQEHISTYGCQAIWLVDGMTWRINYNSNRITDKMVRYRLLSRLCNSHCDPGCFSSWSDFFIFSLELIEP